MFADKEWGPGAGVLFGIELMRYGVWSIEIRMFPITNP